MKSLPPPPTHTHIVIPAIGLEHTRVSIKSISSYCGALGGGGLRALVGCTCTPVVGNTLGVERGLFCESIQP